MVEQYLGVSAASADRWERDRADERRKFARLPVTQNAVGAAYIRFQERTYYTKFGRIVDISRGGLAFEYEGGLNDKNKIFFLDIKIGLREPMLIQEVPFTVVYDRLVISWCRGVEQIHRRCGLRTGDLTEEQLAQLETLMEPYAIRGQDNSPTLTQSLDQGCRVNSCQATQLPHLGNRNPEKIDG